MGLKSCDSVRYINKIDYFVGRFRGCGYRQHMYTIKIFYCMRIVGTTFFEILRHQQPLWVSTQTGIKRRSKILELELLQEQSILTIKQ